MDKTFIIAAVLLVLCASQAVHADIINGGFETGDFYGWNTSQSSGQGMGVGVQDYYTVPYEGRYVALLDSLSLAPSSNQSCSITQGVAAEAGETLSFKFLYDLRTRSDMGVISEVRC